MKHMLQICCKNNNISIAAGKEWMYQQAKAKCSRNQYGLAEILC